MSESTKEVPPAPPGYAHKSPPEKRLAKRGEWFIDDFSSEACAVIASFDHAEDPNARATWILDPLPASAVLAARPGGEESAIGRWGRRCAAAEQELEKVRGQNETLDRHLTITIRQRDAAESSLAAMEAGVGKIIAEMKRWTEQQTNVTSEQVDAWARRLSAVGPTVKPVGVQTTKDFAIDELVSDLVRECERAIGQRDEFLKTGVVTAGNGGSHDTCFESVLRKHGIRPLQTEATEGKNLSADTQARLREHPHDPAKIEEARKELLPPAVNAKIRRAEFHIATCISLRVPATGDPAIDSLIGRANEREIATAAMQAEYITTFSDATPESAQAFVDAAQKAGRSTLDHLAFNAVAAARSLLAALKGGA